MARIVLDASVTLVWLCDEDPSAARIKRTLDGSDLVAPTLWRLEVANVILVRERRKILSQAHALRLLHLLDELPIEFIPDQPSATAAAIAHTARPHQLSAYDARYLDVAIRQGLPLFTRDVNLHAAAARVGLALVKE